MENYIKGVKVYFGRLFSLCFHMQVLPVYLEFLDIEGARDVFLCEGKILFAVKCRQFRQIPLAFSAEEA